MGGVRAEAVASTPAHGTRRASSVSRRTFLKWSAALGLTGTLGGMGVLSGLGYVKGPQEPRPAWETEPGRVDYSLVPSLAALDKSQTYVLKTAQGSDSWPGSFLSDFREIGRASCRERV